MNAVDLFCGAGGVSQGLKSEGIRTILAIDNDPAACATYRANHPETIVLNTDIQKLDLKTAEYFAPVDLMVVCAPCQPFSGLNNVRAKDSRKYLILEAIRFINKLSPALVFFENVPGFRKSIAHQNLQFALSTIGYTLGPARVINAYNAGAPQNRKRCLMLASRNATAAQLLHYYEPKASGKTVRNAIGHLSALESASADPNDPLHQTAALNPTTLLRIKNTPKDGGNRFSLPEHLLAPCHRGKQNFLFRESYSRLYWDKPSGTITTKFRKAGSGRFTHPEQNRTLSLREGALLQTFPPNYKFIGNIRQIATQIGNAVPVRLIESLNPTLKLAIQIAKGTY